MKRYILDTLKNIPGWRTSRKLVALSVDDYGNIRVDSRRALHKLGQLGIKPENRFDKFDALENREDLEALFDTLSSVRDFQSRPAVLTAFSVPCNIDFSRTLTTDPPRYVYEILPNTFNRLEAEQPSEYQGAWQLWKEGINHGFLSPEFHGREHFHLASFNAKLKQHDEELSAVLGQKSNCCISASGKPYVSYTAAFHFTKINENNEFEKIIADGQIQFERVFGQKASQFNAPGGRESRLLHSYLCKLGFRFIDVPFIEKEHLGEGKFKRHVNWTGRNLSGLTAQVRNVVFEPNDNREADWVGFAMKQIERAFALRKPAIISSHRVNFSGHIEESNRNKGLSNLKELLSRTVKRWPDVEFVSGPELGQIINNHV